MKRKLMVLCLTFVMMTSVLCGCTNTQETGSAKKTKVVLNEVAHSIFYAPMYVAIENEYFAEEGIDLTLNTGFGADKTMTALLTGEADVGFCGPEATVYTYLGDMEDYAVNFAQLTQRAGNFIVGRTQNDSFTWDQLKGTTVIGGRAGGMPQMVFEYVLKKNNIDPKTDLTIDQSIDFGSTAAAFSGGKADYTVEFEPGATMLETKGDGYVIASVGEESGYVPYTAFCARKSFIDENPETLQAFTNALQKGMIYVSEHSPEEIAEVIQPQFEETDLTTITTIVKRYYDQDTWKQDLIFKGDSFDLLLDILTDAGQIKEKAPYADLVNTSFAEEAAK